MICFLQVHSTLHGWGFPKHCPCLRCAGTYGGKQEHHRWLGNVFMILHGKQIVIIKSLSGETTLARILPVPLSLGWNQRHVLTYNDVDVQKLSEIYGPQHVHVFFMIKTLKKLSIYTFSCFVCRLKLTCKC